MNGLIDELDDNALEAIAQVVIRTWLGQLPMYGYDLSPVDIDDEDEEYGLLG